MKKVSIYFKSGRQNAGAYYRYIQYFDNIECVIRYNLMVPEFIYSRFMPISKQCLIVKIGFLLLFLFRVFVQLLRDFFFKPDYLIISRRLVSRIMPITYKILLKAIKKRGTYIIWDFDDNIIESKEIKKKDFTFLERESDKIIIASDFLKGLFSEKNLKKVDVLETTDGDIYVNIDTSVSANRIKSYSVVIKLLWVGTSSSIEFVNEIIPQIEIAGLYLNKKGKLLEFNFVCDKPLSYQPINFIINNVKWNHDVAIYNFLNSHIGLMPLKENEFTMGKGGFKLIQYLSSGLPVVGSSVGINNTIIDQEVGFKVSSLNSSDWSDSIIKLSMDINLYNKYSKNAFAKYMRCYSYNRNLDYWKTLINYANQ